MHRMILFAALSLFALPASADPALSSTLTPKDTPTPAQRVSFAYENGLWGRGFEQGVGITVPFSQHWGSRLRAISIFGRTDPTEALEWNVGDRLELFGQSSVLADLMRLYGGGGVQVFYPLASQPSPTLSWGGGGQMGFEFFLGRRGSFFIEIGGSSGGPLIAGATVLGGVRLFPF